MGQEPQVLSVRKDAHRDLRNLTANQEKANGTATHYCVNMQAVFEPAFFAPTHIRVFLTGTDVDHRYDSEHTASRHSSALSVPVNADQPLKSTLPVWRETDRHLGKCPIDRETGRAGADLALRAPARDATRVRAVGTARGGKATRMRVACRLASGRPDDARCRVMQRARHPPPENVAHRAPNRVRADAGVK
jgi:hypothetical protein